MSAQTIRLAVLASALLALASARAGDSPRVTPTVELIAKIEDAVLPIFTEKGSGTGVLVHEKGFILTADHVTRDYQGFAIFGLTRVPYRIVGRLPEKDLAIVKVDASHVKSFIPWGRSHDLRAGEPILVAGNPGGRGLVFSQGVVNSPAIDPSWPSLLAQTFWRTEADVAARRIYEGTGGRDEFVQFDAMSNRGNSGGPLVNALGGLIGVVVRKNPNEDAVSFAIPVDRVRRLFPNFVQPEETGGFWTGVEVDLVAPRSIVREIAPGSPAALAGLAKGDVILSLGGDRVRNGPDWLLSLDGRKPGESLAVEYERAGKSEQTQIVLADYPVPAPASSEGKHPGLRYQVFRGNFRDQPDFDSLPVVQEGTADKISADAFLQGEKERYAVRFTGYVRFPRSGLYRIWLGSDDGAKLYVNGRLLIDNGLTHPYQELSRTIRVREGLAPVSVGFWETGGEQQLTLAIQCLDDASEKTAELQLFHD